MGNTLVQTKNKAIFNAVKRTESKFNSSGDFPFYLYGGRVTYSLSYYAFISLTSSSHTAVHPGPAQSVLNKFPHLHKN